MEAIDHLQNNDFVEFSKAVKQELFNKVANHPFVKSRSDSVEKYNKIETLYTDVKTAGANKVGSGTEE